MTAQRGSFIISLDFELWWGVRDSKTQDTYGTNVKNVKNVIPALLNLFKKYNIRATFATVGFLFLREKEDFLRMLPAKVPNYTNSRLSPYHDHFTFLAEPFDTDEYYYGASLLDTIRRHPEQEIASHTFSHYYCLEDGQTLEDFQEDLQMAQSVAQSDGLILTSLVFPRNQFNDAYLSVCTALGFTCVRGNEKSWIYQVKNSDHTNYPRKILKLLDSYVNLSGHNCYSISDVTRAVPVNLPASRFLRPYSKKLRFLEPLKITRIKNSMTHAAKNNLVFHLWWHPHNFGTNLKNNMASLEQLLQHYAFLKEKYHFCSETMSHITSRILNEN
ncbi:polysaccharide deacetylase family protein [Niabella drilacis]|uniref:Polysaccharide deacetylase n=1 Tax=Niabella drilacis (strain DSM 25811 / CCM 8410 / CCUG 62505 / LMG 26954 / E90) TaxID=1285928 RepID=A0A1G6NR11_NIADE|nr:polysaccharide deacetylase family protein [Niabella drilacis]SDC70420.1 Polysaccharide deacetylase [Niabella drilacis]